MDVKDKEKQSQEGRMSLVGSNADGQKGAADLAGGDSGPLNSSNSNIEEEFE